jgi:hypothetical protein
MNSQDFTGLHRTSQNFMGLHGTSQDFTGLHRTSQKFTRLHVITCKIFRDLMSNIVCSFCCQIYRRTISKFLVIVLMKGAMKRPSSALTVAPVKKAGKVKAKTSNAALQEQKGKTATKKPRSCEGT